MTARYIPQVRAGLHMAQIQAEAFRWVQGVAEAEQGQPLMLMVVTVDMEAVQSR